MTQNAWKNSYRQKRIADRNANAPAKRIARRILWVRGMNFLLEVHKEIASELSKLRKASLAMEELGVV